MAVRGDGTIAVANQRAGHVLGLAPGDLEGRPFPSLFDGPEQRAVEDRPRFAAAGRDVHQHDTVARHPERERVDVTLNMAPMARAGDPGQRGVSVVVQDITAHKAHERQLLETADRDDLTGLFNRRRFIVEIERLLSAGNRRTDCDPALLVCDVDRFKLVNDRHGHLAGDEVLRTIAATFGRCLRTTDIAARVGGDEFAVLATNVNRDEGVRVAEKLRQETCDALREWAATMSVGVAHFCEPENGTAAGAFDRADRRLYRAKADGGNAVVAS